jgi:hypothetical protein
VALAAKPHLAKVQLRILRSASIKVVVVVVAMTMTMIKFMEIS